MALSAKKKESILADWKTGEFGVNQLARKHKLGNTTISRLVSSVPKGSNAHIVDAAQVMTKAKEDNRGTDVQAAIQAAKRRTKRIEMGETIMDVGMQSTLKIAAGVNKALDSKQVTARDYNTHQKTIKAATETVRLVTTDEAPHIIINNSNQQQQEQTQEQETTITNEETLLALGLL